jgi:hypothetical protein
VISACGLFCVFVADFTEFYRFDQIPCLRQRVSIAVNSRGLVHFQDIPTVVGKAFFQFLPRGSRTRLVREAIFARDGRFEAALRIIVAILQKFRQRVTFSCYSRFSFL